MGTLYWSAAPLPPEEAIPTLWETVTRALPREENRPYLEALMGNAKRRALPRVAVARLFALSLLPPLLERAGIPPASVILGRSEHGRPFGLSVPEDTRNSAPILGKPLPGNPLSGNPLSGNPSPGNPIPGTPAPGRSSGGSFDFNLSHSDGHAACCLLTGGGFVGVDIQEPLPPKRALPLIQYYCTEGELATLTGLSDEEKAAAFTRLWTVREALCKQDGRGMPLRFDAARIPGTLGMYGGIFPDTGTRIAVCTPVEITPGDFWAVPPCPEVEWTRII